MSRNKAVIYSARQQLLIDGKIYQNKKVYKPDSVLCLNTTLIIYLR